MMVKPYPWNKIPIISKSEYNGLWLPESDDGYRGANPSTMIPDLMLISMEVRTLIKA
jgi:hypothetical protein